MSPLGRGLENSPFYNNTGNFTFIISPVYAPSRKSSCSWVGTSPREEGEALFKALRETQTIVKNIVSEIVGDGNSFLVVDKEELRRVLYEEVIMLMMKNFMPVSFESNPKTLILTAIDNAITKASHS